jgi:hypothetical protein
MEYWIIQVLVLTLSLSCYVNYLLYKDLKKKDRIIESQKRKLEEPRVR